MTQLERDGFFYITILICLILTNKDKLEISEGRPPVSQLIMGALAFSLLIFFLSIFITGHNLLRPEFVYQKFQVGNLYMAIVMAGMGVLLSKSTSIVLDKANKRLQTRWHIGRFGFGKWEELPPVDYISVFKAHKTRSINFDRKAPVRYEVNLWLQRGGRKRVYFSYDDEVALNMGVEIAKFLKVDLWDATDPHNKTKIPFTG